MSKCFFAELINYLPYGCDLDAQNIENVVVHFNNALVAHFLYLLLLNIKAISKKIS